MEVVEVVQFYDSDRRFPAWGFGGRTPNGSISHCFNLSGSPSDFEVLLNNITCKFFCYYDYKKLRKYETLAPPSYKNFSNT